MRSPVMSTTSKNLTPYACARVTEQSHVKFAPMPCLCPIFTNSKPQESNANFMCEQERAIVEERYGKDQYGEDDMEKGDMEKSNTKKIDWEWRSMEKNYMGM